MANKNGDVFSITTNHIEMEKNGNHPDTSSFIPPVRERHFLIKCLTVTALDMICMFLGELVGTTFLLLFGCMGSLNWVGTEQPQFVGGFIFGLTVLSIVQCFGTISGAHLNPAVTLCALLYRLISIPMAIAYFIAQMAGAVMGFGLLMLLTPSEIFRPDGSVGAGVCSTVPRPELTTAQVFFLEYFATTVLITLCCSSWDPRNAKFQDLIALKFGFAVAVLSITVTYHSMLKSTLRINDNIDISKFSKLIAFLKEKNVGYKPLKATAFTEEEIKKFIDEAPDDRWLDVKIVCILGVNGVHSTEKLSNVLMEHIKVYEDVILVTMPKVDRTAKRTFTVTGTFFDVMNKYIRLRPPNTTVDRFLLHYRDGICISLPIGRSRFFEMARRVAKFLKLPKPESYSANSFRITPTSIAPGSTFAFESSKNVPNQQEQFSLDCETGLLRTSGSVINSNPYVSIAKNMFNAAQQKNDHRNGIANGTEGGHVCTISCGMVKCAAEENEKVALHAFSILKPSDYEVIEATPALFATDPMCRWIVAYTHSIEPVSSYNAEETFDDLTRSTPSNVKVIQKYIRSKSAQLVAAYIVVYGVNCRCHKVSSSELISFEMDDVKYEV